MGAVADPEQASNEGGGARGDDRVPLAVGVHVAGEAEPLPVRRHVHSDVEDGHVDPSLFQEPGHRALAVNGPCRSPVRPHDEHPDRHARRTALGHRLPDRRQGALNAGIGERFRQGGHTFSHHRLAASRLGPSARLRVVTAIQ